MRLREHLPPLKASIFTSIIVILILTLTTVCATSGQTTSAQLPSTGTINTIVRQPLRYVDFETGDFGQVQLINGASGTLPIIVTNRTHSGTYAAQCRIIEASVSQSSDIDIWGWLPETLPPLYYSFWIYVQAGYEAVSGTDTWQQICEWNAPSPVGGGSHVDISFEDYGGVVDNLYMTFLNLGSWNVSPNGNIAIIYSNVAIPTGQWVQFEIYYVTSMTSGSIQVKMNGLPILHWNGRTQFDPVNGNTVVPWVLDNYCGTHAPAHSFWFDDIWIDYVSHSIAT